MNQWHLELSAEAQTALQKAFLRHPHLKELIDQKLQALLNFPPRRWYRIHVKQNTATFFPEPGQKVRFSGFADYVTHTVLVLRFSIHE